MKWHVSIGIVIPHEVPETHEGPLSDVLRELADRFEGTDHDEAGVIVIEPIVTGATE